MCGFMVLGMRKETMVDIYSTHNTLDDDDDVKSQLTNCIYFSFRLFFLLQVIIKYFSLLK